MTRVLIFGDSHIAGLFQAYTAQKNSAPRLGSYHLDFVGAAGPVAYRLTVQDGKLQLLGRLPAWNSPTFSDETINMWYGATEAQILRISEDGLVDLRKYDVVLAVGGWMFWHWWSVGSAIATGVFSADCIDQLCQDVLKKSAHFLWLQDYLAGPAQPGHIISLPEPVLNELSPDHPMHSDARQISLAPVYAAFKDAGEKLGLRIASLPAGLMNPAGNAVIGKYKANAEGDFRHLNLAGAGVMLNGMLALVNDLTATSRDQTASN